MSGVWGRSGRDDRWYGRSPARKDAGTWRGRGAPAPREGKGRSGRPGTPAAPPPWQRGREPQWGREPPRDHREPRGRAPPRHRGEPARRESPRQPLARRRRGRQGDHGGVGDPDVAPDGPEGEGASPADDEPDRAPDASQDEEGREPEPCWEDEVDFGHDADGAGEEAAPSCFFSDEDDLNVNPAPATPPGAGPPLSDDGAPPRRGPSEAPQSPVDDADGGRGGAPPWRDRGGNQRRRPPRHDDYGSSPPNRRGRSPRRRLPGPRGGYDRPPRSTRYFDSEPLPDQAWQEAPEPDGRVGGGPRSRSVAGSEPGIGGGERGDGDRKRKKKKRPRAANRTESSSSSSSSSSSYDWRQEVWQRGFQALAYWPAMFANMNRYTGMPGMQGMQGWQAFQSGQPGQQMQANLGPTGWEQPRYPPKGKGKKRRGDKGFGPHMRKRQRFLGLEESQEVQQALFEERSEQLLQTVLEPLEEAIVDVPRSIIAKVIGKGGQQICIIRKHSGAQIDARQQHADPCPVKVVGTALAIEKARDMIWDLCELATLRTGTVMHITRAKIGKVIGIKGAQIQEIQMTTGAKVDVDKDVDPCRVTIGGDPDKVEHAKRLVLTLAMEAADGESEYLDLPKNVTGAVLGVRGQRLRELQASSGARIDVDKTQPSCCRVRIAGTPDQIETAKQLVLLAAETPRPAEATVPAVDLAAAVETDSGGPPPAICVVPVPPGQAGKVIGKGGAMVQALQNQSGARVWVDCEAWEVRISGTQEAVETARDLVQELINEDVTSLLETTVAMEPQLGGMAGTVTVSPIEALAAQAAAQTPPAAAARRFNEGGGARLPAPGGGIFQPQSMQMAEEPTYPAGWPPVAGPGGGGCAAAGEGARSAPKMVPPPPHMQPRPSGPPSALEFARRRQLLPKPRPMGGI